MFQQQKLGFLNVLQQNLIFYVSTTKLVFLIFQQLKLAFLMFQQEKLGFFLIFQ